MYIFFTFEPSVLKILENNGIFRLGQIFHLGPIKRYLTFLPENIQDPLKNMYLETAFHKL